VDSLLKKNAAGAIAHHLKQSLDAFELCAPFYQLRLDELRLPSALPPFFAIPRPACLSSERFPRLLAASR
jgi:hypothetical protein